MDLHRQVLAAAERAAHAAERDAHLLRRQVEAGRGLVAVDVQPLRGDEEVDAAVLGRHREAGLGAEEGLVLHPDLVLAADHDLGGGLRVAVLDPHVAQQVAGRVQRVGVERLLGVGDRLEHLVVDLDLGGRVAGGLGMVGGHDRHRLALVADLVEGQHRLVGDLEPVDLAAGHVLVREDGEHAADGQRRRDVDLADPRARVRAAQRGAPQHPVGPQVGRVREVALDLGDPVGAAQALADPAADRSLDAHTATSCIRRLALAMSRAISSSSAVVRRPFSTTDFPPTSSVSTIGRAPSTSAATGSAMPAWSRSPSLPERDVGLLARLERADLVFAAQAARAVDGAQRERLAGGQRLRAALDARDEQRLAQLAAQLARLVGGGAVDPEADRRARRRERRHRRDAGAEPRVRGRAVRHAGAGLAEPPHLALVQVHAVGEPDVVAEPADLLEVLDRAHAEQLEAELLLVERLGHVGVQADVPRSRELGRLGHQLLGDAERRARRERDPDHGVRRRVVEAVDRLGAGLEDRVAVLGDLVGRQAALRLPEVHAAAARVEAHVQLARGLDLDREQVAGAAREDVVVVGARAAAGARQRGQPGAGGGALDVAVDARPHGVELLQPLEQRRLLRHAARGPLVEVVVAVDEPRAWRASRGRRCACPRRRCCPRRPRSIAAVLDDDVPVGVLGARGVDGGDRAALDDELHRCAASLTASRIFS